MVAGSASVATDRQIPFLALQRTSDPGRISRQEVTQWALVVPPLEAMMDRSFVAAILTIASVPSLVQWLNVPTKGIPRTKDGKPDL